MNVLHHGDLINYKMETFEPQHHNFRRLLDQLNIDLSERLGNDDTVVQRVSSNLIVDEELFSEVLCHSCSFLASM